jgi:GntR family transcriptional regulator
VVLSEAGYHIRAVAAKEPIATHLRVRRSAPLLMIERTTYSREGTPVDYENLFYRADRMTFSMRLKRGQIHQEAADAGRLSWVDRRRS